MITSRWILPRTKNILNKSYSENQNIFSVHKRFFFFRKSCLCEIIYTYLVKPERPQMTIWRHVACWINKATCAQAHAGSRRPIHPLTQPSLSPPHTEKICNIFCFFKAKVITRTQLHVPLYTHCLYSFAWRLTNAPRKGTFSFYFKHGALDNFQRLKDPRHISNLLFFDL